jgi:hypothetical protein
MTAGAFAGIAVSFLATQSLRKMDEGLMIE